MVPGDRQRWSSGEQVAPFSLLRSPQTPKPTRTAGILSEKFSAKRNSQTLPGILPAFVQKPELGTIHLWEDLSLFWGRCPVCCRVFSSLPGLHLLIMGAPMGAWEAPPLPTVVTTQDGSRLCLMSHGQGERVGGQTAALSSTSFKYLKAYCMSAIVPGTG